MPGVESRIELTDPDGRVLVAYAADFPSRFGDFVHAVPGWRDGVSHDPVIERRPGDGVWVSREQPGGRLFSVRGVSRRETIAEVEQAAEDLEQFFPNHHGDPTKGLFRALYDGKDRRCVVRIAGSPAITLDRLRREVRWTIPLLAPDPRRYGPPITPATQQVPIGGTESNLLANPSFALNTDGWFGTLQGSTVEHALERVAHTYDGWMGRIVLTSPAAGLAIGTRIDLGGAAVTDVLVDVVTSPATSLRLSLTWLDAAGRALRTDLGAETAAAADATVRLAMPVTPPAGAARLTLIVDGYGSPWAAGSWLGVHRALVGTATDYRDGDSHGWVWDGRAGASASRKAGVSWLLDNSAGTADSVPLLQFTPSAALSSFMVSQSGHGSLQWSGQVIPAGTLVTVDTRGHQVLLDGRLPESRWSGEFPIVEAGETSVLTLSTPGVAATASCTWSPAWW